VHGGLQLEGTRGFSQAFADTFRYLGSDGTPCGQAFINASQVVVTIPTPIVDDDGEVRGIVSTHQRHIDGIPAERESRQLRMLANQCGRWLQWHDGMAPPGQWTGMP
jgi:hypothetical protein